MLKYYLDGQEITSQEYVDAIVEDAEEDGETKTTAMRVVRENRQDARETGDNVWTIHNGAILVIERA